MDYGKLKTYYESIDGVTVPFVYPQYWDKDKEEWVVVDKDNRLPVDARLTGSKVERVIILESTAMTEDRLNTQVIDVSKYNKVTYYINSTINVDLEVRARINGSYVRYFDASSNTWKDTFEGGILPAYSYNRWRPLNNLHPPLNDLHYDVRFDLRTNEIPTEGSVEIILVGELN